MYFCLSHYPDFRMLQEALQYVTNNRVESIAALFGFICVYFNTRENMWGWPMGILSVGLYVYVFFGVFLYMDFVLHIIYLVLGFYGWYQWQFGGTNKTVLPVTQSPRRELWSVLGLAGLATCLAGYLSAQYTQNNVPYSDAAIMCFSLAAQWQLAKKRIENWLVWVAVDAVCVGVYYYKDLKITALLYFIYLFLATYGYFNWRKQLST